MARLTAFATERNTVLYISGEESQAQVRMRASRIGAMEPNLLLASTTDLSTVLGLIEQFKPALAIVDSAQTIVSQDVDGISGGSTQVREVASALIDTAKTLNIPVLLVGHVTKDGPSPARARWSIWWMWSVSSKAMPKPRCVCCVQ